MSLFQLFLSQVRIPNTENSHLITGLIPGVTYIVQVYAVIKEIQSEADKIEATTGEHQDMTSQKDMTAFNISLNCFSHCDIHFW